MKTIYKIIGALVLVMAGLGIYFYKSSDDFADVGGVATGDMDSDTVTDATTTTQTATTSAQTNAQTNQSSKYKNGTYNISEVYMSPGGKQNLGVSVTVAGDKITNTVVTNGGTDGDSKSYQNFFISKVSSVTIGNSLDNLNLGVTAGASLTTRAFNDALAKIRKQATI